MNETPRPTQLNRFLNNISISADEKLLFIEHVTMLLAAGMDMIHILESAQEDIKSNRLRKIIRKLRDDVDAGFPLWQALDASQLMPRHVVSLVRIGEQSGRLPENLKIVVGQQRRDREFAARIRSALLYPGFVLMLTVIIGLGISWFILPKLTTIFAQLDVDLPLVTRLLIIVGAEFGRHGAIIVPSILIGLCVLIYVVFIWHRTRFTGQALLLLLPGVRKLVQEIEISHLGYMLGTLLDAGLPIVEALDSVAQSAIFYKYKKFYLRAARAVNDGQPLRIFFAQYHHIRKLFPSSIEQLVVAGEQSGALPKTLLDIGVMYEEKITNTTKNLSVILEPILLVIVWLGVITVALAVVLPVYSLIGGLRV
ncbi:MAG: type II secretion system F family protein [Candidatus Kerfeldbacteria bacterium]|nr:type II secretion system F family protein [Candidatus Kerfeldbacteria bacterium]